MCFRLGLHRGHRHLVTSSISVCFRQRLNRGHRHLVTSPISVCFRQRLHWGQGAGPVSVRVGYQHQCHRPRSWGQCILSRLPLLFIPFLSLLLKSKKWPTTPPPPPSHTFSLVFLMQPFFDFSFCGCLNLFAFNMLIFLCLRSVVVYFVSHSVILIVSFSVCFILFCLFCIRFFLPYRIRGGFFFLLLLLTDLSRPALFSAHSVRTVGSVYELWGPSILVGRHVSLRCIRTPSVTPTFTFTYPLTAGVVGAPLMISQPVSSVI